MTIQNGIIVAGILVAILIALLFVAAWLFYGNVYKFSNNADNPTAFGLEGVRVVDFKAEDGDDIIAWIKPPMPDAPVILYFMGNFTSIGPSVATLKPFLNKGYGLAALVYRGSSGAQGQPSEKNFVADARALFDQLDDLMEDQIPEGKRLAYGYSLGTGVAVQLASERNIGGVILVSAYSRFCNYFTDRYYGLPFCFLMHRERYDSIDRIGKIDAPLLMLHGEQDKAINIRFGKRLFDAAAEPKRFVSFESGTHTNLIELGLVDTTTKFYEEVINKRSPNQ
jgi:uncharacterized protein